jgi:heme/copper-type cytochrome/quinol oxidase subunit 3
MQLQEYINAPFGISDGVYGSAFYMLTGLHGLHVIVGSIFLIICFVRFTQKHLTPGHHLGFEFAA